MTSHEFAREVARIVRESLYVNDGTLQPCVGGVLNPLWVQARANNIAVVVGDLFETEGQELARAMVDRGAVVKGEIRSRYHFEDTATGIVREPASETAEEHAERILRRERP